MARPRAPTRPLAPARRAPARRRTTRRPPASRPRARSRAPLLTPEHRRELSGVATMGVGLVLGVALGLPGGGSIAAPVHDGLLGAFGAAAWLAAAALILVGARVCGERQWRGGFIAALGSAVGLMALLGLLGLMAPGAAGSVGRQLSEAVHRRLGFPAAVAAMVVATFLGLVLAVDLRVARLAAAVSSRLAERRAAREAGLDGADLDDDVDPVAELTGVPEPRPLRVPRPAAEPRPLPLSAEPAPLIPAESVSALLAQDDSPDPSIDAGARSGTDLDDEEPAGEDERFGPPAPFTRDFEELAVEPAGGLGEIPTVAAPHLLQPEGEEAEKMWNLPGLDMLDTASGKRERLNQEVRATEVAIVQTLRSFGIETRIVGSNSGPTVTQYELQPATGVPVRKIVSCQTDLSLALAAPIRIQPFIPGKSAVGIEVPNKAAQLVTLKEIVQAPAFGNGRNRLGVALGADVSGHPVVGDLTRMPHLLIAGATGSGKSVCINAVLGGLLLQATPAELKLILIDPKRVELSGFADIPHLLVPVVVEPEAAVASLRWAVKEMEERYKLFASHGARNIAAFNERAPGLGLSPLPYTIIVIDELADLMMVAAGEIEDLICRIAQLARAVGIHLIVATQRPSADIITGIIKANIPSRVAFAVSSGVDSRVILDEMGAEKLLGRGDMLYLPIDEGKPRRLQGAFVSDRELEAVIEFWKAQGKPDYQEEIFQVEANVRWAKDAGKRDPLFNKAAHLVAAEGRAAASLLQRKLSIGYTRAARLVDQLAEYRVVGPYDGAKSREILMDVIEVDEFLLSLGEE
ncbi:MAG: DNA translocase FtsK [Candidatus Dormibacteria bacterium]